MRSAFHVVTDVASLKHDKGATTALATAATFHVVTDVASLKLRSAAPASDDRKPSTSSPTWPH